MSGQSNKDDVMTPESKPAPRLRKRHRKFLAEYLVDLNATKAAIRAGYTERNADAHSYRLLRRPDIAAAVAEALAARQGRMQVTAERVLLEYARIGFSDIRDVADWGPKGMSFRPKETLDDHAAAAIAEIVPSSNGKASGKIKLYDKKAALDALARHTGLFDPRRSMGADRTVDGKDSLTALRERILRAWGRDKE
jgi:phage terminase small subunit